MYVCVRERKGRKHDVVAYLDYAFSRDAHHRLLHRILRHTTPHNKQAPALQHSPADGRATSWRRRWRRRRGGGWAGGMGGDLAAAALAVA